MKPIQFQLSLLILSTNVYSTSGVIASPFWPFIQYHRKSCSWEISVSRKYVVQVNVMDMDSKMIFYCDNNFDRVVIVGK